MSKGASRIEVDYFLRQYLEVEKFDDYAPNGIQIEGKEKINTMAFAVSADLATIKACIEKGADALLVHHGAFWKYQGNKTVTGTYGQRLSALIRAHINLFAYHLPLDAHFECGNAVAIAKRLGLVRIEPFGDHKGAPTGVKAQWARPVSVKQLQDELAQVLGHSVIVASSNTKAMINSVGIITGGASSDWRMAVMDNLDAFITGELKEYDWSEAQEAGMHVLAGGHYATEQFGVQELMEKVQQTFPVKCVFIPSANPA